ncbi:MAG TPA: hypothetical protein VF553_01500 [Pyrinomonadaceae bacterium]
MDILSLDDNQREWLVKDCLRRAAHNYEKAEVLREAAVCWSEAGETTKAAELYLQLKDYERSASMLLYAGRYDEARAQYEMWLTVIRPEDALARVTALLGLSLCLIRMKMAHAARGPYLAARAVIESDDLHRDSLASGRCWEALAQYGLSRERLDIVQVAYENALSHYGPQYNGERVRAAQDYLRAVRANRLLAEELTERLNEWSLELPPVDRTAVEPGRQAAFIARGRAGNVSDVDYLMHMLESEPQPAITRLVDYALGLVQTPHGEERIRHYLFEGTQAQRNYAALYFRRMGRKHQPLLLEAFNQGKIDRA